MTYHVTPYTPRKGSKKEKLGHKWQVKHEGSDRASVTTRKKSEAKRRARGLAARHTGKKIVVHGSNGQTQYAEYNDGTAKSPKWKRT